MLLPILLASPPIFEGKSVTMYIGTYTDGTTSKGVYAVHLDTQTGTLSEPRLAAETSNPSYLAMDAKGRFLYAVNEQHDGGVTAFHVGKDETLTQLSARPTGGAAPCHLSVGPGSKTLMVANYMSGSLASFPIESDGSLGPSDHVFQNAGHGPDRSRQEASHMHWIQASADGKTVYACDLGTDEIIVCKADLKKGQLELGSPSKVKTAAGDGPRHGVFDRHGKFLYVDDELGNRVTVYKIGDADSPLTEVQKLSTLPEGEPSHGTRTAEIVMHPSEKWLYVSNRGHESIAVYEVHGDGLLSLVEIKKLDQIEPRGFAIDPSGKWLVVAGQTSNDLGCLQIDPKTGKLSEHGNKVRISSPVSVMFAPG